MQGTQDGKDDTIPDRRDVMGPESLTLSQEKIDTACYIILDPSLSPTKDSIPLPA